MGFLSKFEGRMEDTVEGAAERLGGASISPVQIAKKAEKQMKREKVVGAGKQYAPTLYTVLVSPDDDARMFNYYPTLAGETETYLHAKAAELGLAMDGQPLVRFIADDQLKRGKFDIVAELVAGQIVERLRADEMARYGIAPARQSRAQGGQRRSAGGPRQGHPVPQQAPGGGALAPLPNAQGGSNFALEDVYESEYDDINSANIVEPDWETPNPAPMAAAAAAVAAAPQHLHAPHPAAHQQAARKRKCNHNHNRSSSPSPRTANRARSTCTTKRATAPTSSPERPNAWAANPATPSSSLTSTPRVCMRKSAANPPVRGSSQIWAP